MTATPHTDELDLLYASEREVFLAALDDGFSPAGAAAFAEEFRDAQDEEQAAQSASEIAAENAWLHHAENAGWADTLEDERRQW